MTTVLRQVAWGKGLMVEISEVRGGLRAVVDAVRSEVGPLIGSRNTFAKLYDVGDPGQLEQADQYRAWLLLVTIGADPDEWGVSSRCLPPASDAERLKERLPAALGRRPDAGPDGPEGCAIRDSNPEPADLESGARIYEFSENRAGQPHVRQLAAVAA